MDPEDILSSSLHTLYDYQPITLSSAGSAYTYQNHNIKLEFQTPDTHASNWSLHASSIWASALYLADHVEELQIKPGQRILELGAGAGIPGIFISKCYPDSNVVVSDYPDSSLIQTLQENIVQNGVIQNCSAVAYAWGSSPLPAGFGGARKFDIVVAADTLWNPDLHVLFVQTLTEILADSTHARIHLVAGLHTGRYTLQSFMDYVAKQETLVLESVQERESSSGNENLGRRREWDVSRAEKEDERERRRWIVWMVLRRR